MSERGVVAEPEVPETYRIDHYYSIEGEGEFEEGHIFCTPAEAQEIESILKAKFPEPDFNVEVEGGGEYDYSTEGMTAADIAADIIADSGFDTEDDDDES